MSIIDLPTRWFDASRSLGGHSPVVGLNEIKPNISPLTITLYSITYLRTQVIDMPHQ